MATKRIYGKTIKTYSWVKGGGALINRVLEVYQTKRGLKALLWDSSTRYWREIPNKPINGENGEFFAFNGNSVEETLATIVKKYEVPEDSETFRYKKFGTIK